MKRCRHCKKRNILPLRASHICLVCEKIQTDRRRASELALKNAKIEILALERRSLKDRV